MAYLILILIFCVSIGHFITTWREEIEASHRAGREREENESRRAKERAALIELLPIMQEQRTWFDIEETKILEENEDLHSRYVWARDYSWSGNGLREFISVVDELYWLICKRRDAQGLSPLPMDRDEIARQEYINSIYLTVGAPSIAAR